MKDHQEEGADFLKDKLYNYEEPAGDNAWKRLNADLDGKKRRGFFGWWFFPALGLLLAGGIWLGFEDPSEKNVHTSNPTYESQGKSQPITAPTQKEKSRSAIIDKQAPALAQKADPVAANSENQHAQEENSTFSRREKTATSANQAQHPPSTTKTINRRKDGIYIAKSFIFMQKERKNRSGQDQIKAIGNPAMGSSEKKSEAIASESIGKSQRLIAPAGDPTFTEESKSSVLDPKEKMGLESLPSGPTTIKEKPVQDSAIALNRSPVLPADTTTKAHTEPEQTAAKPDSTLPKPNQTRFRISVHLAALGFFQQASIERQASEYEGKTMERYSNSSHSATLDFGIFGNLQIYPNLGLRLGTGLSYWQQQVHVNLASGLASEVLVQSSPDQPGYFSFIPVVSVPTSTIRQQTWLMPWLSPQLEVRFGPGQHLGFRAGIQAAWFVSQKQSGGGGQTSGPSPSSLGGSYGVLYRQSRFEAEFKVQHQFQKAFAVPGLQNAEALKWWMGLGCGYWF